MPVPSNLMTDQALALEATGKTKRSGSVTAPVNAATSNVQDLDAKRVIAAEVLLGLLGSVLAESAKWGLPLEDLWGQRYVALKAGNVPDYSPVFKMYRVGTAIPTSTEGVQE